MAKELDVILGYRSYKGTPGISHAGLGVSAINTAKALGAAGIRARTHGFVYARDIYHFLRDQPETTHVVMSAPWIKTHEWAGITHVNPGVDCAMVVHSNVAFLGADYGAVQLLREQAALEMERNNFSVGCNNTRLSDFFEARYDLPLRYLPNLYHLPDRIPHRDTWFSGRGTLRVGCFGATRQQKNIPTAVAAALQLGRELNADVIIYMNSARNDDPLSHTIRRTCKEFGSGSLSAKIVEIGWLSWSEFRQVVGEMHINLQPSFTETFNMVCADSVSRGVPCVVGPAIEWAPSSWKAEADSVDDVVRKSIGLLADPMAPRAGERALRRYVKDGLEHWVKYLRRRERRASS